MLSEADKGNHETLEKLLAVGPDKFRVNTDDNRKFVDPNAVRQKFKTFVHYIDRHGYICEHKGKLLTKVKTIEKYETWNDEFLNGTEEALLERLEERNFGQKRRNSAVANNDAMVGIISRETLLMAVENYHVRKEATKLKFLKKISILGCCADSNLHKLIRSISAALYKPFEFIIKECHYIKHFYLVKKGTVDL